PARLLHAPGRRRAAGRGVRPRTRDLRAGRGARLRRGLGRPAPRPPGRWPALATRLPRRGGWLELGFGTGGNRIAFGMFGRDVEKRHEQYDRALAVVREALGGKEVVP